MKFHVCLWIHVHHVLCVQSSWLLKLWTLNIEHCVRRMCQSRKRRRAIKQRTSSTNLVPLFQTRLSKIHLRLAKIRYKLLRIRKWPLQIQKLLWDLLLLRWRFDQWPKRNRNTHHQSLHQTLPAAHPQAFGKSKVELRERQSPASQNFKHYSLHQFCIQTACHRNGFYMVMIGFFTAACSFNAVQRSLTETRNKTKFSRQVTDFS